MAFQLGQTIGDYEFIDVLRSSKSSVAYRVRNVPLQRFEVLKLIPGDLHNDQERTERFLREIKICARLNHPNILTFYNAGHLGDQLIMTTELVEAVSLEDRLELGALPWQEAAGIVAQTLAALDHAHQLGVIHREITPANILITTEGAVKLTGFGLAKAITDPKLTQTGVMMGATHYMSPEQVRGEEVLDGRSDLYSLGVVLYQTVTGRRPFESKSQFDVMLAHISTPPTPPIQIQPALPESVNQVILAALAKDPKQRYQSAPEFAGALESIGDDTGTSHPAPVEPVPVAPPLPLVLPVQQVLVVPHSLRAESPPAGGTSSGAEADTTAWAASIAARSSTALQGPPEDLEIEFPRQEQAAEPAAAPVSHHPGQTPALASASVAPGPHGFDPNWSRDADRRALLMLFAVLVLIGLFTCISIWIS